MSRCTSGLATKGSQFQLQRLINDPADSLGNALQVALALDSGESIAWVSPLASDKFTEYRDASFLAQVGLTENDLVVPLTAFWPNQGPCWDALARTNTGRVILVEGKSHIGELSSRARATGKSLERIQVSLHETRSYYRCATSHNWLSSHYQYCNRLAHLYWLRVLNGIDAHLVFFYFANDDTVDRPANAVEWANTIDALKQNIGLNDELTKGSVHNLIVDLAHFPIRVVAYG